MIWLGCEENSAKIFATVFHSLKGYEISRFSTYVSLHLSDGTR